VGKSSFLHVCSCSFLVQRCSDFAPHCGVASSRLSCCSNVPDSRAARASLRLMMLAIQGWRHSLRKDVICSLATCLVQPLLGLRPHCDARHSICCIPAPSVKVCIPHISWNFVAAVQVVYAGHPLTVALQMPASHAKLYDGRGRCPFSSRSHDKPPKQRHIFVHDT
jgi:hypothetical protein